MNIAEFFLIGDAVAVVNVVAVFNVNAVAVINDSAVVKVLMQLQLSIMLQLSVFITIKSAILRWGASGLATFTITIERDHDLSHFLARPEYKQPI